MATIDKRPMKAYVRFDGMGRVVPSSLILRRKKPKVGNWVEIPAYECCNDSTTSTTTTIPCFNTEYQIIITSEDLADSTGNTGINVLGPDGQEYTTEDGLGYFNYPYCYGASGGSGRGPFDNIVCASQPPYVWYFKNNEYVIPSGAVVSLGTPC